MPARPDAQHQHRGAGARARQVGRAVDTGSRRHDPWWSWPGRARPCRPPCRSRSEVGGVSSGAFPLRWCLAQKSRASGEDSLERFFPIGFARNRILFARNAFISRCTGHRRNDAEFTSQCRLTRRRRRDRTRVCRPVVSATKWPRHSIRSRRSAGQHEVGRQRCWNHFRQPIAKAWQVNAPE